MPILDLQVRARELGRIRLGQVVATSNGKTRPSKIDRFRFTSYSRELLEHVAELYGGRVRDWQPQGGGAAGYEVLTDAKRVPILVPPQPLSQWYELWSGGGCARRCDGTREVLSDAPCVCSPEPDQRECKPTTRLNVMLRDVPGLGVWRLETHGYYAAVELPAVAQFLAATRGYVSAALVLEERVSKRDGQTRRYMVPAIEVEKVTPAQLLAGQGSAGLDPAALGNGERPAIEAGPSTAELVAGASTRDELVAIREDAKRRGEPGAEVDAMLAARAAELGIGQAKAAPPADANEVWLRILSQTPEGWTSSDVEIAFEKATGIKAENATAADMTRYLEIAAGRL
ncbi:MAG TPA: hypothetical protein VHZ96_26375 [Frankiaceae bacterium]|jgi:hypothetical protein|nr:hypothetical protein [Frankiaceae bacterium]